MAIVKKAGKNDKSSKDIRKLGFVENPGDNKTRVSALGTSDDWAGLAPKIASRLEQDRAQLAAAKARASRDPLDYVKNAKLAKNNFFSMPEGTWIAANGEFYNMVCRVANTNPSDRGARFMKRAAEERFKRAPSKYVQIKHLNDWVKGAKALSPKSAAVDFMVTDGLASIARTHDGLNSIVIAARSVKTQEDFDKQASALGLTTDSIEHRFARAFLAKIAQEEPAEEKKEAEEADEPVADPKLFQPRAQSHGWYQEESGGYVRVFGDKDEAVVIEAVPGEFYCYYNKDGKMENEHFTIAHSLDEAQHLCEEKAQSMGHIASLKTAALDIRFLEACRLDPGGNPLMMIEVNGMQKTVFRQAGLGIWASPIREELSPEELVEFDSTLDAMWAEHGHNVLQEDDSHEARFIASLEEQEDGCFTASLHDREGKLLWSASDLVKEHAEEELEHRRHGFAEYSKSKCASFEKIAGFWVAETGCGRAVIAKTASHYDLAIFTPDATAVSKPWSEHRVATLMDAQVLGTKLIAGEVELVDLLKDEGGEGGHGHREALSPSPQPSPSPSPHASLPEKQPPSVEVNSQSPDGVGEKRGSQKRADSGSWSRDESVEMGFIKAYGPDYDKNGVVGRSIHGGAWKAWFDGKYLGDVQSVEEGKMMCDAAAADEVYQESFAMTAQRPAGNLGTGGSAGPTENAVPEGPVRENLANIATTPDFVVHNFRLGRIAHFAYADFVTKTGEVLSFVKHGDAAQCESSRRTAASVWSIEQIADAVASGAMRRIGVMNSEVRADRARAQEFLYGRGF